MQRSRLDLRAARFRGERERRIAELSRDVDDVAGTRATAPQRGAGRQLADGRDAQRARPARRIATDQLHVVFARERVEAAHELRDPCGIGIRQCAGEQREPRQRAHRGQVGQVDGERLVPQRARIAAREKVPILDQHVDGDDVLHAGRRREHRTVVADADPHVRIARLAPEKAVDQLELIHHAKPRALPRREAAARACRGRRSRTCGRRCRRMPSRAPPPRRSRRDTGCRGDA